MRIFLIIYLIFFSARAFGQHALSNAYSAGLEQAQGSVQKTVPDENSFKPAEIFKDAAGNNIYTENSPQVSYYQKLEQGNKDILEAAGRKNIDKNDAIEAVWKSFGNPKIKIDPNEQGFGRSREIIKNSASIATGVSSKPGEVVKEGSTAGINCQESKICRIENIKKSCNEEVREKSLKKICEKIPKITTQTQKIVYPNCQKLIITQGAYNRCPAGYIENFYVDMYAGGDWDDIRFCTKTAVDGETSECFSGSYYLSTNAGFKMGQTVATVPKKMHARIRVSNVSWTYLPGSVINETTGESIYYYRELHEGEVIELPYSETQDQRFRFYTHNRSLGVMVLYIDRIIGETKTAKFEGWGEEIDCREI